jgi:hypothetical protein
MCDVAGWLLSSLIRRVDPMHRTLAQFMKDEICGPMDAAIFCGIPENEQRHHQFADVVFPSLPYILFNIVLPSFIGLGDKGSLGSIEIAQRKGEEAYARRHRTCRLLPPATSLSLLSLTCMHGIPYQTDVSATVRSSSMICAYAWMGAYVYVKSSKSPQYSILCIWHIMSCYVM